MDHGKATLFAIENKAYICGICVAKYPDEEKSAAYRRTKACTEVRDSVPPLFIDDKRVLGFKTCPGNYVSAAVLSWRDAHRSFAAHGVLPFPGALSEQPAKVMDLFRLFDQHDTEKALEERRRQMRNQKGKARGR